MTECRKNQKRLFSHYICWVFWHWRLPSPCCSPWPIHRPCSATRPMSMRDIWSRSLSADTAESPRDWRKKCGFRRMDFLMRCITCFLILYRGMSCVLSACSRNLRSRCCTRHAWWMWLSDCWWQLLYTLLGREYFRMTDSVGCSVSRWPICRKDCLCIPMWIRIPAACCPRRWWYMRWSVSTGTASTSGTVCGWAEVLFYAHFLIIMLMDIS